MVSSTCLNEKLIVCIQDMNLCCRLCECNIEKGGWGNI